MQHLRSASIRPLCCPTNVWCYWRPAAWDDLCIVVECGCGTRLGIRFLPRNGYINMPDLLYMATNVVPALRYCPLDCYSKRCFQQIVTVR